jgi:hypothetical protein
MPANVVKAASFARSPTDNKKRLIHQLGCEVVSRVRNPAAMTDHLPGSRKNDVTLSRRDLRGPIIVSRKRPRPRNVGIDIDPVGCHGSGTF